MGADMLIQEMSWDKSRKLDWEAGIARLNSLEKGCFEYQGTSRADMMKKLKSVRQAVEGNLRDAVVLEYGNLKVLLSGGMSWGDSPSDLYNDMNDLIEIDNGSVIESIGFDLDNRDYKSILMKVLGVLKESKQLPVLIHLDGHLDELLEKMLRSGSKPKRRKR